MNKIYIYKESLRVTLLSLNYYDCKMLKSQAAAAMYNTITGKIKPDMVTFINIYKCIHSKTDVNYVQHLSQAMSFQGESVDHPRVPEIQVTTFSDSYNITA